MRSINKNRMSKWLALSLGITILIGWLFYAAVFVHRIERGGGKIVTPEVRKLEGDAVQEEFLAIYQHGRRAGYSHTRLRPQGENYALTEELFLRINFLNEVQDIFSSIEGQLAPDFSLQSFDFRLQAGPVSYRLSGGVKDNKLLLVSRMAGQKQRQELPLSHPIYLGSGLKSFMTRQQLEVGDIYRLALFDPATLSQTMVPLQVEAKETIRIRSRKLEAYRVVMEFHGVKLRTWISPYGELLKEEGFLGMTMVRTDGEDALRALDDGTAADLVREAAVVPNRTIIKPRNLKRLRLRLTGITRDEWDLAGGRQNWEGDKLSIVREPLEVVSAQELPLSAPELAQHLQPSFLVQSDAAELREQAAAIVGNERNSLQVVSRISSWVHDHLEKRPTLSIPNALEVYKRRAGDCNEHSVLFAGLARAAGIPTRIAAGLLYADDRFFYHAWNEVYIGQWVAVDSLLNQVPADPTHIRLIMGELDRQVKLVRVIGRLDIQVLDYE